MKLTYTMTRCWLLCLRVVWLILPSNAVVDLFRVLNNLRRHCRLAMTLILSFFFHQFVKPKYLYNICLHLGYEAKRENSKSER